ncbi:MAG TPA: MG2 domain-containing protein, partial [Bacteroidales bacterium]|nr:MG2 domain-containing protein [Bacteroidales bacterium]
IRDTRLVALSDIGLMAIRQGEDLMIWAFSIKTAEPRSGVNVKVISRSNQVLFSGTTNDDGSLLYKREGNAANLSPYVMITAKQNEDFNAMLLANSIVETSRFDMTGRPALMEAYDAFIYGPRDIYRPGDSLFAVGLVRDRAGKVASSLPVTFRLLGPSGQVVSSQIGTTDNAGVLSLKTKISKNQLTGRYNLVLLSADDRVIGQRSLLIEEFVPDRMEVKLKLNKASFNSGDSVILNLSAATLFGTSAPNRLVE